MPNILDTVQISGSSYDLKDKNAPSVSAVTQQEYDNLPSSAKTSNTFFVITDAQAGDLSQYWTSAQTNSAITQATSGKQDTLVSGTNIKTINNESILGSGNIDIQGGGKAVSGGTNISITTGETADTINCTIPVSADTNNSRGVITNYEGNNASHMSFAGGYIAKAKKDYSFAFGIGAETNYYYSTAIGQYTKTTCWGETAFGSYNKSVSASTSFDGNSGNTLFSVGNGTAENARHNAFEIRQNGDIYLSLNGQDVKLQDQLGGGGGKAIEAGRGITVTTGETADTVSFDLPISAGTGTNALIIASDTYKISDKAKGDYSVCLNGGGYHPNYAYGSSSFAQGMDTRAYGNACFSEGYASKAGVENNFNIQFAHAEGDHTEAKGSASHTEGSYTIANNWVEHASGRYNNSVSASTTFGDSGNTLFSVGNGTAYNARHNAFEIRQNGDIYLSLNGQDVKLQDQLGGSSITVDTALDSGSTNPVENRVIYNKIDEVEQVTAAALNELNDAFGGLKLMKISQTDYDNLQVKDQNTLYVII